MGQNGKLTYFLSVKYIFDWLSENDKAGYWLSDNCKAGYWLSDKDKAGYWQCKS